MQRWKISGLEIPAAGQNGASYIYCIPVMQCIPGNQPIRMFLRYANSETLLHLILQNYELKLLKR